MDSSIPVIVRLQVHKNSIAVASANVGRSTARYVAIFGPRLAELTRAVLHLGETAHAMVAYDAGRSGFSLVRWHSDAIQRRQSTVASKVIVGLDSYIQPDTRDALTLAGQQAAPRTHTCQDSRDEAIRNLARALEDAVRGRLKAPQEINDMLSRRGQHSLGKAA